MDNIDKEWLINTNNLADLYDAGEISITEFSNDQLQWLIYWNWGFSGTYVAPEAKTAENELIARGVEYNQEYAELIETKASNYY
jgi:hypothetical protein